VPKPFSTVQVAYGRPTLVQRNADQAEIDEVAASLQRSLGDLSGQVGDAASLSQRVDAEPLGTLADTDPS